MKKILASWLCLLTVQANAGYKIGQSMPNLCWTGLPPGATAGEDTTVCLDDVRGVVRVLLFNAGWCGPCQEEFKGLVPRVQEFKDQAVMFVSISGEGYSVGSEPDRSFLIDWKKRFRIPFWVTASPRNFGEDFNSQGSIPNVAVIDKEGKLRYVHVGADGRSLAALLAEIRKWSAN